MCRKLVVDDLTTRLKGRFLQLIFQQNPDKKPHVPCAVPSAAPCITLRAQPAPHQHFLLLTSKVLFSHYSKMLGVFAPVPYLGPTWLVEEILIKCCSVFMSNMLQWEIYLSDAGIAYLVFLTPSKQLVQGST